MEARGPSNFQTAPISKESENDQFHLSPHPLADVFETMDGLAFDGLKQSILDSGLLEPITTYQNKILDGRNRYRACVENRSCNAL